MNKLLVHIGSGKTGTSAIQNSLRRAQDDGQLAEAYYPNIAGVAHHSIANAVLPVERLKRGYSQKYQNQPELKKTDDDRTLELLNQALQQHSNVILSSEYFCSLKVAEIRAFKDCLDQIGFNGDVGICIYVRDPVDFYVSLVPQQCKASSIVAHLQRFNYKFKRMIQAWSQVFPHRIIVREYSPRALEHGNVVSDFCAVASRYFDTSFTVPALSANRSLSLEALIILQRYRKLVHAESDNVPTADTDRLVRILEQQPSEDGHRRRHGNPPVARHDEPDRRRSRPLARP